MLKRLKIKFVVINMLLVGIVLLVVFMAVCSNTYKHGKEEVDRALEMALSDNEGAFQEIREIGAPPDDLEPPGEQDSEANALRDVPEGFDSKPMSYTAVVVLLDDETDGYEIMEQGPQNAQMNDASMNEATLKKAVAAVRSENAEEGKLSELGLFYRQKETNMGTKVAFVDAEYFDSTMDESILSALTLFGLGMAGLLLISILLANMAVAPVKRAWEQQKRFIADASHELKTPLTVILANNEILLSDMTENPEERRKWLESSGEEALHMKGLVDDLLFLARADEDARGRSLIKRRVDLSDLVTEAALQFEPLVFEAGLAMTTEIGKNISYECDDVRMKRLIHILLDNAVKYAGNEGRMWLGLEKQGDVVRLLTANTGDVMDKEELEHIFDRFYRSDKARTDKGGYGLGLSIARTIAEDHGGKLKAASGDLSAMDVPAKWQVPPGTKGTLMELKL